MPDDVAARNTIPALNIGHQRNQRIDLRLGKRAITKFVTRIHNLDTNACRIDVLDAAPARLSGVPRAVLFLNEPYDLPIFGNQIMRGNLCCRISKPIDRRSSINHAGVVQNNDGDRQQTFIEIGRRRFNQASLSPAVAVRIVTMATPANAIVPPSTITGVSGLPNTALEAATPITGAPSVTGITVVTG